MPQDHSLDREPFVRPEPKRKWFGRWAALVYCTVLFIGCLFLAGGALLFCEHSLCGTSPEDICQQRLQVVKGTRTFVVDMRDKRYRSCVDTERRSKRVKLVAAPIALGVFSLVGGIVVTLRDKASSSPFD
jgi:hypothetical protein